MGADAQGLIFRSCTWNREAAAALAVALAGDDEAIRSEVERGEAGLWEVAGLGWVVTRVEVFADGRRELVIVAQGGRRALAALEVLERAAKRTGCESVRIHSGRRGTGRLLGPAWVPKNGECADGLTVYRKVF